MHGHLSQAWFASICVGVGMVVFINLSSLVREFVEQCDKGILDEIYGKEG